MRHYWYVAAFVFVLGLMLAPLSAQPYPVLKAAWSPVGDQIAVFSTQTAVIYDTSLTPQQEITFFTEDDPAALSVWSIVWSPLANKIAGYIYNHKTETASIRVWDVKTGEQLGEIALENEGYHLTWLPDNEQLAILRISDSYSPEMSVYQIDGTLVDRWDFRFTDPDFSKEETTLGYVSDFDWAPSDTLLVTHIGDGPELSYWNAKTQEWIKSVWCCSIVDARIYPNSSGRLMLLYSPEAVSMEVRNIATGDLESTHQITGVLDNGMSALLIAAGWRDSARVWGIGNDGSFHVWRPKVATPVSTFSIDLVNFRAISPDGTQVLYAKDDTIWIEELETGKALAEISQADDTPFSDLWISPLTESPYLD